MALRRLIPLALFFLTLLLRLPTASLPLEGDAALLASEAERVGDERSWVSPGTAPVLPLLAGTLVSAGVQPTAALRWMDLLLGCFAAPLAWLLARRLGAGAGVAAWLGLLLAVHPLLAVNAGGVHPGPDALGLTLLLAALLALVSPRAAVRRGGALLALMLALAHPAGPLYLVPLLVVYAMREPGPRWQVLLPVLGLALLLWGPLGFAGRPGAPVSLGTLLLEWLPLAGLGVLWIGCGRGALQLLRRDPELLRSERGGPAREPPLVVAAWLVGAAVHVGVLVIRGLGRAAHFDLDAPAGGALLVPLVLLTGLIGLAQWGQQARPVPVRWARRAAAVAAGAAAVFVVTGPLQIALVPAHPIAAGRLSWLRSAVDRAAEAAGDRGWIVLGVAEDEPATQASLADAHAGRAICRRAPLPEAPEEDGLRVLLPFPASAYPADQPFGLVLPAPRREQAATFEPVTTFGGAAIFEQELVARVGAYLVIRVRGTLATDGDRENP